MLILGVITSLQTNDLLSAKILLHNLIFTNVLEQINALLPLHFLPHNDIYLICGIIYS